MKHAIKTLLFFLFALSSITLRAQAQGEQWWMKPWSAYWITVPGASEHGYGVYVFRKVITLSEKPSSFTIHVSADNRYKLYVNGTLVSLGPARGDIAHWNYETVDLSPYLKAGKNTIAAQVWNEGEWRAEAQLSLRTAFVVQGATEKESVINTNNSWKCIQDSSYTPLPVKINFYYVAGPGEIVNMQTHLKDWRENDYRDNNWKDAQQIFTATAKHVLGGYGSPNGWMLVPSTIPQMELKRDFFRAVRSPENVPIPSIFSAVHSEFKVPANKSVTLILDQSFLTNAYLSLDFSGGKDATITLSYAEALFTTFPEKGNRNDIAGKTFYGRRDSIISNGSKWQLFTSLTWRTFRYVKVHIITKQEALVLGNIYSTFTGFPFELKSSISSGDTLINAILERGWRTARLCAMETYMDCPYYEQLQYVGDTRIQALVSLFNTGDDRLVKQAIDQIDHSRNPEGITMSRYPTANPQYIPMFSLWYLGMLHDYWMYGSDTSFVKDKLPGERQILDYFHHYQDANGSLKNMPEWMFTDWVFSKGWNIGVGPVGKDGTSAMQDLQLLWAYQVAAEMEHKMGIEAYALVYNGDASTLKKTILKKYWDDSRKLFADREEKDLFSQHTNALAILTGLANGKQAAEIGQKLLADSTLAPASIYFKYYLHLALVKAGMGNDYLHWLAVWKENIRLGLTTWAELPGVNSGRSDCHAWGASPNIEFYRTVLGIDSDAPGFTKVKITPRLGHLKAVRGEMPHPQGTISVAYRLLDGKWKIDISLPGKLGGTMVWAGKTYALKPGDNAFSL